MYELSYIIHYIPGTSILARLDPRSKLLMAVLFIASCLASSEPVSLSLCFLACCGALAASHIQITQVLRALCPLIGLIAGIWLMNLIFYPGSTQLAHWWIISLSREGLEQANLLAARLSLMSFATALVVMTSPAFDLAYGLEKLLSPLQRLRLPIHEISFMMGLAISFVPLFITEWQLLLRAQSSRGACFGRGRLIQRARALASCLTPLFASVLRRAETLGWALEARCYHGGTQRSRLYPIHMSRADYIGLALSLSLLCISILLT